MCRLYFALRFSWDELAFVVGEGGGVGLTVFRKGENVYFEKMPDVYNTNNPRQNWSFCNKKLSFYLKKREKERLTETSRLQRARTLFGLIPNMKRAQVSGEIAENICGKPGISISLHYYFCTFFFFFASPSGRRGFLVI